MILVTNLDSGEARCARVMPDNPPPGYESYQGWKDASNCSANDTGICRTCADDIAGTYACDLARTFRVGIPADQHDPLAIDIFEGPMPVDIGGDKRQCSLRMNAKRRTDSVETFEFPVEYRTQKWAAGDDLVALEDGYGFQRATPMMRRFIGLAGIAIEGADPAIYAPHYSQAPLSFVEDGTEFVKPATNVLNVTTIGDPNVPVNTGVAIAKVAGFIELQHPDPRWGKTPNRVIIDEGVQLGIPWLEIRGPEWGPVLVDVDNLTNSTNTTPMDPTGSVDGFVAPRLDPPLRNVAPTFVPAEDSGDTDGMSDTTPKSPGTSGIVFPLLDEFNGRHGFPPPGIMEGPFDVGQFMEHQIGWFFSTYGEEVRYDPCMADLDACEFVPTPPAQ